MHKTIREFRMETRETRGRKTNRKNHSLAEEVWARVESARVDLAGFAKLELVERNAADLFLFEGKGNRRSRKPERRSQFNFDSKTARSRLT